jgi:hypothetical protein
MRGAIVRQLSPIAVAVLLTAGCTQGGVIYNRSIESTSIGQAVGHLRGSEVVLVVRGNPVGGDQAEFGKMVAEAIHGANPGTAATFVPTPADKAQGGRRIVLVFNGPAGSNGYAMCGTSVPAGGTAEPGGHIRALAAFCGGDDRPLSYLSAGAGDIEGADDPGFHAFLREVVHALLPTRDPDFRPDNGREWPQ